MTSLHPVWGTEPVTFEQCQLRLSLVLSSGVHVAVLGHADAAYNVTVVPVNGTAETSVRTDSVLAVRVVDTEGRPLADQLSFTPEMASLSQGYRNAARQGGTAAAPSPAVSEA